jgi:hypothetical protein
MDTNDQIPTPETNVPVQLQLAGLETKTLDIDPRFILSDEVCSNGLRHIAEIRRYLAEKRQIQAA